MEGHSEDEYKGAGEFLSFLSSTVTLKLNSEDVQPVISTFQRHAYTIQTFLHAPEVEEEMRERYDAFMRFLKQ
jgi:hypothetical protein